MPTKEERRAARASWTTRVFRGGFEEQEDADALFWDAIPLDERAEVTWQLSREVFELARGKHNGPRLPRSALRLRRR